MGAPGAGPGPEVLVVLPGFRDGRRIVCMVIVEMLVMLPVWISWLD